MLGGLERDRDRDRDLIALHRRHDPITALPVAELHTGPRAAPRAPSSSGGRRRRMLAETRTQRTVSKRLPADHARGWLLVVAVTDRPPGAATRSSSARASTLTFAPTSSSPHGSDAPAHPRAAGSEARAFAYVYRRTSTNLSSWRSRGAMCRCPAPSLTPPTRGHWEAAGDLRRGPAGAGAGRARVEL